MKTLSTLILGIHLIFGIGITLAQAPEIEWQKSLGGSDYERAESIIQTADEEYIVVGSSSSNDGDVSGNHGDDDFWIVKLTSLGIKVWQKSHGGSGFDGAFSVQEINEGGYIVAGISNSTDGDVTGNFGSFDYWFLKVEETGNFDGEVNRGGSGTDYAYQIQQTNDGGYILAGESNSTDFDVTGNNGGVDFWIVKTSSQGSLQWQKSLGGSGVDMARSIQQTADGGYIIAGNSNSTDGDVTGNHGGVDFWIVKTSSQGGIEWQKSLGGSNHEVAYSIQQTEDGGYIVAGYSSSTDGDVSGNHGGEDYWVVKMNASGGIEWQKSLGGSGSERAKSISQTSDGGYIVAGYSSSTDGDVTGNQGNFDFWVVKLNAAGILQWQKSIGGSDNDQANSINQTTDGGYILAGYSHSNDGDITGNHGGSDFWVVKLEPDPLSVETFESSISIYPNPVSSVLNISANEPIKLVSVYNQLGQEVMASSHLENTLQLDMSGLPSSLYFVEITTDKSRESFKIIVN